jgi:hypothetical protein
VVVVVVIIWGSDGCTGSGRAVRTVTECTLVIYERVWKVRRSPDHQDLRMTTLPICPVSVSTFPKTFKFSAMTHSCLGHQQAEP